MSSGGQSHPVRTSAKRKLPFIVPGQGTESGVLEGSAVSHADGGGASLVSSQENKQWPSIEMGIVRRATRKDSIKR